MKCLICGNEKKFNQYLSLDYLKECPECGFVFMAEIQQPEDYYEAKTSRRFDGQKQETRFRNCRNRLNSFKKFINRKMNILEVGCNEGSFLKIAKESGYEILGLEPNDKLVEYANNLNLPVVQGIIETFRPERQFDAIVLFNVLEHLKDPAGALRKMSSILSPGGYLVLEIPSIDSFLAKKQKEDWEMITVEHFSYFSQKTITAFLNSHGFSVKQISVRQFDEWHLGIKECLTRLGFNLFKTAKKPSVGSQGQESEAREFSQKHPYLNPVRVFMSFLVKILKRGDYILVVAQKSQ